MVTQEELLTQLIELQKESLRWLRFQSIPALKKTLETALDSDQKKQIYELTDGGTPSRKIASIVKVHQMTVVRYWNEWVNLGILEKEGSSGRAVTFRKICSLTSVGIAVTLPGSSKEDANILTKENKDESLQGDKDATSSGTN